MTTLEEAEGAEAGYDGMTGMTVVTVVLDSGMTKVYAEVDGEDVT